MERTQLQHIAHVQGTDEHHNAYQNAPGASVSDKYEQPVDEIRNQQDIDDIPKAFRRKPSEFKKPPRDLVQVFPLFYQLPPCAGIQIAL